MPIQDVFQELVGHESRNRLIQEDLRQELSHGRRCLVLSQRRDHCRLLSEGLARDGVTPFVLDGSLGKKERVAMMASIRQMPRERDLVVIATGQYLGEGFDCPQIDTLFLVFPVSFKGKLVQYVGRVLRECEGKSDVVVYDYADLQVSVLKRMHLKRLKVYKSVGFHKDAAPSDEILGPLASSTALSPQKT